MVDHIHYMHNKTEVNLRVEERKADGSFSLKSEILPGKKDGPYDKIPITDLRFVVQSPRPVYFEFIPGKHKDNVTHIDGQTGHPGGGTGES